MQFQILGPLEVLAPSGPLEIRGHRRRSLLALLLVHAGEALTLDRIVEAVWGEDAPGAANTVQTYISQLRKVVVVGEAPEVRITTVGRGYRLEIPRDALDATVFEDRARAAMAESNRQRRRDGLLSALECWRGAPLPEFRGMEWADAVANRLELRRLEVLEQRIDVDLALGRARDVIAELDTLVAQYPLTERFWAQRMVALYRCGRQSDALRSYSELRALLADELGIEPSPQLAELELRILDHDASLLDDDRDPTALLASPPAPEPTDLPTGTVTFLLTDIVGSTELWDDTPQVMAAAVREHEQIIEQSVSACSGHLLKRRGEGDSTLSVFARAADALDAAIKLRDDFAGTTTGSGLSLAVRIALHTGEVEERDRDYFGPTLNRAARIRGIATGNEILCSRTTADLVADALPPSVALIELGALRLRGMRRSEVVYRVVRRDGSDLDAEHGAAKPKTTPARAEPRVRIDLLDEPFLVARDAELDRLSEMLAAAAGGRPQVLFVRGDAGVGKTRLLRDFVDSRERDVEIHVITCTPQGASARVALADLIQSATASETDPHEDVAQLLRGHLPVSTDADTEVETARFRALTTLRDAIRALAGDSPAVLVIEDIHWAEPGLLELLEFLVQDVVNSRRGTRLLLAVTRRTFAVEPSIEAILARLERLPGIKTMTLRPLRDVDVDELVRSFGVDPPGRQLVQLLYERSRGNPLYVREALRHIADLDGFVRRAGRIETVIPPTEFGAPADLRDLVERRLADLSEEVVDVLSLAAVAGEEFDPELLDDVGTTRAAPSLATAANAGLLAETTGGYRFTHSVIHAAVYDALPPELRRMHHRTLAAAIDRLPAETRDARLLELAHHLLEGGVDALPPYVAEDLWNAGDRASALAEWAEAARCYDGAIAVFTRAGAPERDLAWMRLWSARAHERHYNAETAVERYWEVADYGREHGELELWGRAALALATRTSVTHPGAGSGHYDPRATAELSDALSHIDASAPRLRSELLSKYAELQYQSMDVLGGLQSAAEALSLAEEADDGALRFHCRSALAYGHLAAADAPTAVALLADVRSRVEPGIDAQSEGFALTRLALGELALGQLEQALRTANDAFVVFDAARHYSGAAMAAAIRADLLLRRGELAEGEEWGREAARLYRISEYAQMPYVLYTALAVARSQHGDFAGALEALEAWTATGQRMQGLMRALLAVRSGDPDDAAARFDQRPKLVDASLMPSILQTGQLGALVEIARAIDRPDIAQRVLEALDARASSDIAYAPGFPFHAERTRALALHMLGDEEAGTAYRRAIAVLERAGAEPELAIARSELQAIETQSTIVPVTFTE